MGAVKQKTAFITGIGGQDAAHLAKFLLEKGYRVIGGQRRSGERSNWRLKKQGILDQIEIVDFELLDESNMKEVIQKYQPDEFYNLAAQSFVGTSFRQPLYTLEVNGTAVCKLLELIRQYSPDTKFYQASTSEMFGEVRENPQSELTPLNPVSPYGVAKLAAHFFVETYRKSYDMFACCGILFNHEGEFRGDEFVTKKITNWVAKYKEDGDIEPLRLGNINSRRDWGYAKDYVEAMWKMLQVETPDTYVIATGKTHTVREFVEKSFKAIGVSLEWRGEGLKERAIDKSNGKRVVEIDEKFYRPCDVELLLGDATKAKEKLGWESKTSLDRLVEIMVNDGE